MGNQSIKIKSRSKSIISSSSSSSSPLPQKKYKVVIIGEHFTLDSFKKDIKNNELVTSGNSCKTIFLNNYKNQKEIDQNDYFPTTIENFEKTLEYGKNLFEVSFCDTGKLKIYFKYLKNKKKYKIKKII